MSDVAREAGVSLKSVSRVVNDEPHISQALREKVEAAITSLNYVPDQAARSLAGARSFVIGVMLDNPSPHYTMELLGGMYDMCRDNGYHLRIDNLDSESTDKTIVEQIGETLHGYRVDGYILTPPICDNPAALEFLERNNIRYSRIAPILDIQRSPSVKIDDRGAAARMADLLLANGHRRLGLVNGPASHGAAVLRRQGFLDRVAAVAPDVPVIEVDGGFRFETGIIAGKKLLSPADRPTGVFAANDDSAAGVMTACAQLGLTVPGDVSICGFDDSWVALSVWPNLTTIHQPVKEMAQAAAAMLFDRTIGAGDAPLQILDYSLMERASVGPAPGSGG